MEAIKSAESQWTHLSPVDWVLYEKAMLQLVHYGHSQFSLHSSTNLVSLSQVMTPSEFKPSTIS
jgi:hypothetical protein